MDNFAFDVQAEGRESLESLLTVAFANNAPGGDAWGWKELKDGTGIFLVWSETRDAFRFPCRLSAHDCAKLVQKWLEACPKEKRLNDPGDFDGSVGNAFRLYVEDWGHVDGDHYAIVAIQATWAWYGK